MNTALVVVRAARRALTNIPKASRRIAARTALNLLFPSCVSMDILWIGALRFTLGKLCNQELILHG